MTEQNESFPEMYDLVAETDRIMAILDPLGERDYELRNITVEKLLDFLEELATVPVPTNLRVIIEPIELIQKYTELFLSPDLLLQRFDTKRIDRIFSLIGDGSDPYRLPALAKNTEIPFQLRAESVRATYSLYERVFTIHNIDSMRWYWSYLCASHNIAQEEKDQFISIVFETLSRILQLNSAYCQYNALYGLWELKHPNTKYLVDSYIEAHPELPKSMRDYALAVTKETLYDITEITFDEFLDFLFVHQPYEGDWYLDEITFDPLRSIGFYIRLFNEPKILFERYSREQLEKGFWVILSGGFDASASLLLAETKIALDLRLECISAMYHLYERFFAVDILITAGNMWWDMILNNYGRYAGLGKLNSSKETEDAAIRNTILETLTKILQLDSMDCQFAALHGLGHQHHPGTEKVIMDYLNAHPELNEGTRIYALACITGEIM